MTTLLFRSFARRTSSRRIPALASLAFTLLAGCSGATFSGDTGGPTSGTSGTASTPGDAASGQSGQSGASGATTGAAVAGDGAAASTIDAAGASPGGDASVADGSRGPARDAGATPGADASGTHDAASTSHDEAGVTAAGDSGVPLNASLLTNCTGTSPIVCAIAVPNGNYDVTVALGSKTAAATTRVQSELLRIDVQPTSTAAGALTLATFTVNVRQEIHSTYTAPGGILNLLFDGTAPALAGLGVAAAPTTPTVFLAGDSTVCDWDPTASDAIVPPTPSIERGWGQELSQYFAPGLAVADYAVSGQTAGSFYGGYFPQARTAMKAGDYLFVQFGHNDQKNAADIAAYSANLMKYITDARAKGVTPVIFTPVARGTGTAFAGLDQQARTVAAAAQVTLVDLTNLSWAYYQTLADKTVLFVPGQQTHFSESGATQVAGIVAKALQTSGLGLASFVK